MDTPLYKTTDVYLSSFVLAHGATLAGYQRLTPKKVEFRFIADEQLHELLRFYWSGQPGVFAPGRLFKSLRHLKCLGISRPLFREPSAAFLE